MTRLLIGIGIAFVVIIVLLIRIIIRGSNHPEGHGTGEDLPTRPMTKERR